MKEYKHIQNFIQYNENILSKIFSKGESLIKIDDSIIDEKIELSKNKKTKKILNIIKKYINKNWEEGDIPNYITLSEEDFGDNDFDEIKEFGFGVKKYNDSNEYSDDHYDKFKISWNIK